MDTNKLHSSGNATDAVEEKSNEIPSTESTTSSRKSSINGKQKNSRYELSLELQMQIEKFPEILEFIRMLQKCIEKQRKKIKKHKKDKLKAKSVFTQTVESEHSLKPKASFPKSLTEEITDAAQQALQHNGFVYEETSGLYYDYNSGYYYNAEYGLYYDGNTGTYLKYNQETKEYDFHSQTQVQLPKAQEKQLRQKHKKRRQHKQTNPHDEVVDEEGVNADENKPKKIKVDGKALACELEDGECSNFSESTSTSCSDDNESDQDTIRQYPPCMRIIVEETAIAHLKQGSLYVITFEGGTIGREGAHDLLLPEIGTSKHHARITFDAEKGSYFLVDVGSRNGTLLNGKRLASAKVESEPHEIPHGSRVQIGSTILMCHVHNGSQTCGHCEPGLLQNANGKDAHVGEASCWEEVGSKTIQHKHQLKQLRKKFGLSQNDQGKTSPGMGYTDRAQHRRATVGSQNPHEKTQTALLTESIASDNKGFKLLSKLGWKEGQALGKNNQGRLEPVELQSNPGTSGVGATSDTSVIQPCAVFAFDPRNSKQYQWAKAQERYRQAQDKVHPSDDIFDLSTV